MHSLLYIRIAMGFKKDGLAPITQYIYGAMKRINWLL
jgi:hypothetical protein